MRRTPCHLAVAIVAVALVASCGNDDGTTTPATEPPAAATSEPGATEPGTTEPGTTEGPGSSVAVGEADTVTIEHYSGTDVVPVRPETIVVLDTGVLLTLDALGIEADGFASLGVPTPDEYADVVDDPALTDVGTAFEPDYEAINAMDPDLIIVATRSSATYSEMSRIAPTVDLTFADDVDYMTAFRDRHEAIGRIFGIEDEVAVALDELAAEIERVAALTAGAGDALIVMTSGNEVSAYGPGSRFGVVHDVLGYAPAAESLERDATHGDVISFEFIADAAPDVLFVIDRAASIGDDGALAETVLDNALVADTPAWQSGRVVYVDAYAWYMASNSIPAMHAIIADVESSVG